MTRIRCRTLYDLALVAVTPLHVGTGRGSVVADAEVARDASGQLLIPGTSLAGVLRGRALALFGADVTEELFGRMATRDQPGWASRVVVGDGHVVLPEHAKIELIQGVGIERISGTAAERFLYDRTVLPAGTQVGFTLEVIDTDADPDADSPGFVHAQRIAALLTTIRRRQPNRDRDAGTDGDAPTPDQPPPGQPLLLGAGTSRGLGHLHLDTAASSKREIRYDTHHLVADLLAPRSVPGLAFDGAGSAALPDHRAAATLTIEIAWDAPGPLMIRGVHASVVDSVPRFGFDGERYAPVLPGASIKGALRTAAERIVRTVRAGLITVDPVAARDPARFTAQLDLPLVRELFGVAKTRDDGRQGAVFIADLYARSDEHRLETWADVQQLLTDPDADAERRRWFQRATHVAIDRFTGGAADRLLYDVLEPHGVRWPPIVLQVDLERLKAATHPWAAVGLLLLAIQELAEGLVPLGAFAERGSGDVKVQQVRVRADHRLLEGETGSEAPAQPERWEVPPEVWDAAVEGWKRWVGSAEQEAPR